MKYLRAVFNNYIGFYNGMGLYTIDIDFTKCNHNIILVEGKNGSGKSTLLNHLHPFPDGSSSFIPDKTAEKNLALFSNGDLYEIHIISPADAKGRKTTKAYIRKNGTELNENGNVSSYKDIIFSEFELDSNYISLSSMSSNDRGLGDKTPSERKKFVSNIIDNLEIYNNMYKTLNKKSLVYKSHISTLHTKIQNIGEKQLLEQKMNTLKAKSSELNSIITDLNNKIVSIQAKNALDENDARDISLLTESKNELSSKLNELDIKVNSYYHKTKIKPEDINDTYTKDNELLTTYSNKVSNLEDKFRDENARLNSISNNILSIKAELENSNTDSNIGDRYNDSNNTISNLESQLKSLGVSADTSLINKIENLISFCDRFSNRIDLFIDGLTPSDIDFIINQYGDNAIPSIIEQQKEILATMNKYNQELTETKSNIKALAILEQRPKQCKVDSCPFISESINIKKSLKEDPTDKVIFIEDKIKELAGKHTELQNKVDYTHSMSPKKMQLGVIIDDILENMDGLSIFYPEFANNYTTMIINMNSFGDIKDHRKLTDGLNLLKLLESEKTNNALLKVEYDSFREKIHILNSSRKMLEKLQEEETELLSSIKSIKFDIDNFTITRNDLQTKLYTEIEYKNIYEEFTKVSAELDTVNTKLNEYELKSSKALEALSSINIYKQDIEKYAKELSPILDEISSLSGQLTLLNSYYEEYNTYKQQYDIIETLKKYCNPTNGGIQTLFMQIYMSKTKDLANSILGMLFGGSYQLLDFIINESEFRIPFIGEGLPVDDISSGSSAQVMMMSMIINLVLLHQGSTKFNIARLDEPSGPLDSYNNSQFINVLFKCMSVLEIEQLFLISHSTDLDNTFADIIKFKGYDNYEDSIKTGNVIWDYNDKVVG